MAYILKGRELPVGADATVKTPCIFCGTVSQHFNEGGSGWYVGSVVDGVSEFYAYCHPPCPQGRADQTYEKSMWHCTCGGPPEGDYVENVGAVCATCRRPREEKKVDEPARLRMFQVGLSGLGDMRGTLRVSATNGDQAANSALGKLGNVSWNYHGMDDSTVSVDDVTEVPE